MVDDEAGLNQIAGLPSTGGGKAFLKAATKRRDSERQALELNPQESREIRHDFRYKLGYVAALNWILELPQEVQQFLRKTGR